MSQLTQRRILTAYVLLIESGAGRIAICVFAWLVREIFGVDLQGPAFFAFTQVDFGGISIKGDFLAMELREGQRVKLTATPKRRHADGTLGLASYETGSAKWSTSGPEATVEVNPDNELEAWLVGANGDDNTSGVATLTADGDPDKGDDQVKPIIGTIAYTVTRGDADVFDLTAGTPEDVPTAPPTPPVDGSPANPPV